MQFIDLSRFQIKALEKINISDNSLNFVKWFALAAMIIDHIDAFFFNRQLIYFGYVGRAAMPLFGFILGFNLARVDGCSRNAAGNTNGERGDTGLFRILVRLSFFGFISVLPHLIAVSYLGRTLLPLNAMVSLAFSVAFLILIKRRRFLSICAAMSLLIVSVFFVEYGFAIILQVAAVYYLFKSPSIMLVTAALLALSLFSIFNGNQWAFSCLGVILFSGFCTINLPRCQKFFYLFYPLHFVGIAFALQNFV